MKQESFKDLFSEPDWARKREMQLYALNLIKRDLSHIAYQADLRKANSKELTSLLDELSDIIAQFY